MKQKGDELIVMSKKMFFLILSGFTVIGIILGFSISFVTSSKKEVKIEKVEDLEKTVLPSTVETALAKKQEAINFQNETKANEAKANESKQKEAKEIEIKDKETQQISEEKDKLKEKESQTSKTEKPDRIRETHSQIKTQERTKSQNTDKISSQTKKGKKTLKYYSQNFYTIQIGAFSELSNAETFLERLKSNGYQVYLIKEDNYKVRIGKYLKFSQAKKVSEELLSKGFENFILKKREILKGGKK